WEYHAPIDEAEIRKEVTENIRERKERLAWESVSITDDGKVRAERKIATGYVHLKAGGDATDWEDYETEYTTQEFYFNGTRSVKLGATGALFTEEFDIGAAYEETQEDIQQYGQDVYEQMDDFMESLQRADDMNDSRETLADNNKQDKATSSKLMSSLLQTLYGGGDLGSWAQQQGQNVMASTIAEATGLPKSFFSGLLGGMTMEGAMENYMYDRIATELDDASGIDGFGSFFNQKVQEAQERAAQHKAMRGGNLLDFNQQFRHNELFRETVMMTIPGGQSSFSPISRVTNAIQQEIPGVRDIVNMPGNLLKNAMGWNQLPENWTSMNSEELQKAMDGKYTRRALREQMNDRLKADYKNLTKLSPKEIVPYATELIQESYLYNKLAESLGEKQMTDAERTFRESTSQIWADATGISLELAESLYVDQLSLDKALENEFYRQFEEQVQLDGAGDYLRELKEEADLRKKLHAGRRNMNAFNPEYLLKDPKFRRAADVISMGSSKFLFENKVFNYDDLLALQAGDLKGKALLDKISGIDAMNQYSKFNLGTGFQEIIQSTALGTLMTVMSKPQDQMSAAEYEFRTSLAEYTAWAFGAPEEFMKTIMVEEGDLETAIMNQFWQNVEDQYGVPGLGDVLAEEYQKALERKAAHEAARIKPEDIVLMPSGLGALTYIWRNAEHNKTLGTLVQLAETVGSAVAAATGVGLIAVLAYQTAKQTYTGSLHGGTQGALVGLYSGLANGALAMAGSPVNFNLSYDFENGFSGSVGANVPIAEGSPWSVGGRLNFTEETGLSGFSLSGGYTHK
ncbi:MAG: TIGR04388 family protein, partial [Leptospiraceae bacterium]|nr:TIGR04388 family protein [Leptospiraceae bacterium]